MTTPLSISIIDFFESSFILNIKNLSPVQKMLLKIAVGEPLDIKTPIPKQHPMQDKEFANEVEMFLYFSDKSEYIPGKKYSDFSLAFGRRSGKSLIISAGLAIYYATQKDFKKYLGTSPFITIAIISPTREQSSEVFAGIRQMFLRSPYLFQTFLNGNINAFADEYSEEDVGKGASLVGGKIQLNNKVVIRTMAADVSRIRGSAIALAILDEFCWLGVEGVKNTDTEILNAIMPATAQFQNEALIIKCSSPNGENGVMFNDYQKRKEHDTLHLQIPTWYANPSITEEYLEKQNKLRGSYFFNREYGAQYTASEHAYLDPQAIDKCIIRGMEQLPHNPKYVYVAAMDYAARNDLWTFNIGHKEYMQDSNSSEKRELVYIDYCRSWKGSEGQELDPSVIVPQICNVMKHYKVSYCISDQYAFAALKVFFMREGCTLKEYKIASESKLKYMYSLQISVNSNNLRIVNIPTAIQHLKNLREKRTPNGTLRIEHANGCHDDYAQSVALCLYQFDKTSPIYVGVHEVEENTIVSTTDALGRQIATPTAAEIANKLGISDFYDNRNEKQEDEKEDPDNMSMWYLF